MIPAGARLGPLLEVLEAGRREGVAPGLAGAVLHAGRQVHASLHGDAQVEPQRLALTAGHHFDVASLTKVMATATLAAAMVDRGEIALDEPAARWLPAFGRQGKGTVTLRQLLSHTSGLPGYRPYYERAMADPAGRAAFLPPADRPAGGLGEAFGRGRAVVEEAVCAEALEAPPGARHRYSDLGFMALGWVLERAGGAPLDRLCDERIFAPLALSGTFFLDEREARRGGEARRDGEARGEGRLFAATERCPHRHEVNCGAVNDDNAWALGGVAGHAGLFSTADDVAALGQSWLDACAGRGSILRPDTARAFTARSGPPGTHALGWDTPTPGTTSLGSRLGRGRRGAVGHLGYTGCSLWIDLDAGVVCALLTNHVHPLGRDAERLRLFRRRFHDAVAQALGIGDEGGAWTTRA